MQQLKLLGGASVETDTGPVTGRPVQRRRLALLALLALARSRGVSRDKVVAYLWPESDAENGRRLLSDSVYRINQALGDDTITPVADELRLDPEKVATDVVAFEDALGSDQLDRAVELYVGPFLDGFFVPDAPEFERWADGERARLALAYAQTLERLADAAESRGDLGRAVHWWRRLAGLDPLSSRVALRLVQALDRSGERGVALQQARVHAALLREELGIEPDEAFTAFVNSLRTGATPSESRNRPAAATSIAGSGAKADAPPPAPTPPDQRLQTSPRNEEGILASSGDVAGPSLGSPLRTRLGNWRLLLAALIVLALLALSVRALRRSTTAADSRPRLQAVAVLPFVNLSSDPDNEYFSDGISEELINTLTRVEGLEVASRTSAFAFKNRQVDIREVARHLGVGAIVEGSVRKSGRQLRITVQLVRGDNGYQLWSQDFDREMNDVIAVQEEIARAIVTRLAGTLITGQPIQVAEHPTTDPEAYDLYLKGRYAWHQRTRAGLVAAIDFFRQAVDRAPTYARAFTGLADAHAVSAFYDYADPRHAYPRADSAARRALAIDPGLAAPHATLGYVLTYYHLDWGLAEQEFRHAIALDPAYSTAHQWYGNLLTVSGRFDEAQREMRLAQESDPLSLIANAALCWSLHYGRRYQDAFDQCRKTLALNADFELAHLWGGWALEGLGRTGEAADWIARAVRISKGSDLTRLALAHVMAPSKPDSSRLTLQELAARAATGAYVPSYEIGKVYVALGDPTAAFQWLERAQRERSHSMAFLGVDPGLDPIRGDARFAALCRAAGATAMSRVARDGIEPPTRGFSVRCSTN